MPRALGFLQLLVKPVAHAGKKTLLARRDRLFNVLRFVITLVAIAANGNEKYVHRGLGACGLGLARNVHLRLGAWDLGLAGNVHYCFGRRIRRGVRAASSGTAGLPAVSHAPTMKDATAEMESLSRRSSVVSVPFANASK